MGRYLSHKHQLCVKFSKFLNFQWFPYDSANSVWRYLFNSRMELWDRGCMAWVCVYLERFYFSFNCKKDGSFGDSDTSFVLTLTASQMVHEDKKYSYLIFDDLKFKGMNFLKLLKSYFLITKLAFWQSTKNIIIIVILLLLLFAKQFAIYYSHCVQTILP